MSQYMLIPIILATFIIIFGIILLIRKHKVYKFTTNIYDILEKRIAVIESEGFSEDSMEELFTIRIIIYKTVYEKILFSFKPLKLENWYTEKEIALITNYKNQQNENEK